MLIFILFGLLLLGIYLQNFFESIYDVWHGYWVIGNKYELSAWFLVCFLWPLPRVSRFDVHRGSATQAWFIARALYCRRFNEGLESQNPRQPAEPQPCLQWMEARPRLLVVEFTPGSTHDYRRYLLEGGGQFVIAPLRPEFFKNLD